MSAAFSFGRFLWAFGPNVASYGSVSNI